MELPLSLNAEFIDSQFRLWKSDPQSVSRDWRVFFEGFELAGFPEPSGICDIEQVQRQVHVQELIHRYRDVGHLLACLDPLLSCPYGHPLLDPGSIGLSSEDLDRTFYAPQFLHSGRMTLREIIGILKDTYCRSIGVEYMHLQDPAERLWLQERMESTRNRPPVPDDQKVLILNKLCQATSFEQFLNTAYVGQKRFSIEGAEVVVAMMETLVRRAAENGYREMILGMAHRGRLNVQVNILQKPYEAVFCEFEDHYDPVSVVGTGDVKYHKGYMADIRTVGDRSLRILLASNPSHLETVDPVVEGIARARQEQYGDNARNSVLPVLIHGDAAFAAQGIVTETLNLSQLDGYATGGTVHIVINNQIGFTTLPEHARSTRYSTDAAKMLMVPIFHVHGEDPEAACHAVGLAHDYRMEFKKDAVIDVVCFRRYGHNEGDEPYYTQPKMYDRIRERPTLFRLYGEKLVGEGVVSREDMDRIPEGITQCIEAAYRSVHDKTCAPPTYHYFENWEGIEGDYSRVPADTGVPGETLVSLAQKMNAFPAGFSLHPRLKRILERRLESVEKGEGIDWATAELLAFASLLTEGVPVRLSGQDSLRGTFSQRHSVVTDVRTGEHFTPLNALSEDQAPYLGYDSPLSENAVLAFEYGYSLASPRSLVLWEAQFGDFANNAQAIIDQFISSAQYKWQLLSGLVLLLPHGLEGQGAEHSSARIERFLQLCAEDNLQVCNPGTPAQYFHLLRRQMKRNFRKPLVVMTPKSLLRHPLAVSAIGDFTAGSFKEVIDDSEEFRKASRVVFCSGKIYYELLEKRAGLHAENVALVRIEQLYPFPGSEAAEVVSRYSNAREWFWVQEEPENMGCWEFVKQRLRDAAGREFRYVGRPAAASPATGSHRAHREQQAAIIQRAMAGGVEDASRQGVEKAESRTPNG